jgi:hypothetical protein
MDHKTSHNWSALTLAGALVGLLAWPGSGEAQTVTGQARAVQATVLGVLGLGTTTTLADTGTLGGTSDAREASQNTGSVPSLLTGDALHATTIGWPDQVASEASLGSLAMTIAGIGISADFVMARALSVLGSAGTGLTNIDGLSISGVPIFPTGDPNQTIAIPGGRVVINEQVSSAGATVVNALHVVVNGVADVVIASAKAGIF